MGKNPGQLDVIGLALLGHARVPRAVRDPSDGRTLVRVVEVIQWRAGVDEYLRISGLTEPRCLMKGRASVQRLGGQVCARLNQHNQGAAVPAACEIGQESIFLGVAGARYPRMCFQQAPGFGQVTPRACSGQLVGGVHVCGHASALKNLNHVVETAPKGMGIGGLALCIRRFRISAGFQENLDGTNPTSPGGDEKRGFSKQALAGIDIRSIGQSTAQPVIAGVVPVQMEVEAAVEGSHYSRNRSPVVRSGS